MTVSKIKIVLFICVLIGASTGNGLSQKAADANANGADDIIAHGSDGFIIRANYMDMVREIVESKGIMMTPSGYANKAIEIRLFAKEAEKAGLPVPDDIMDSIEPGEKLEPVKRDIVMAAEYINHVADNYPLDDDVLMSYQRVKFEKYREYDEESGEYVLPEEMNEEMRSEIHKDIMARMMKRLRDMEIERLKEKYSIVISNLG